MSCEGCRLLNIISYSASGTAASVVGIGCQSIASNRLHRTTNPCSYFFLVLGTGTRLFGDGTLPGALRLVDQQVGAKGVIVTG
jgi:hypothetical protein